MRGEVGRAAIKRQRAPAAAESRDAAVAVLQIEQPAHARAAGGARGAIDRAEREQGEERAGGVVGIGHAAGQVGPRPAARRGVGGGMLGAVLLPEQPRAQGLALLWRKRDRLGGEGFDGEGGHPGGEICVDGPAPVRPRRGAQKLRALSRHGMFREAHRRKAHGHETRQRHGFEEAAVFRLDGRQHAQRPRPRALAEEVGERVPRRAVVMDRLPDRDERRQRVADHRQPQRAENLVRQRRQLEGQRHDVLPADASAEREGHQDRHGKGAVLAVARGDGGGECPGSTRVPRVGFGVPPERTS